MNSVQCSHTHKHSFFPFSGSGARVYTMYVNLHYSVVSMQDKPNSSLWLRICDGREVKYYRQKSVEKMFSRENFYRNRWIICAKLFSVFWKKGSIYPQHQFKIYGEMGTCLAKNLIYVRLLCTSLTHSRSPSLSRCVVVYLLPYSLWPIATFMNKLLLYRRTISTFSFIYDTSQNGV